MQIQRKVDSIRMTFLGALLSTCCGSIMIRYHSTDYISVTDFQILVCFRSAIMRLHSIMHSEYGSTLDHRLSFDRRIEDLQCSL